MRPLRFLLTLTSCIVAFFLLLYVGPWRATAQDDLQEKGSLGTYFNWRTPSSLFPPSAIISLTDDNSTFFLARPAAFGPLLPAKSLSGQLWIGSGFGADRLGHSGSADGELGCSDMPGWSDGGYRSSSSIGMKSVVAGKVKAASEAEGKEAVGGKERRKRDVDEEEDEEQEGQDVGAAQDDGTDDHLHHPLSASDGLGKKGALANASKKPAHADIQSLQEGAEIAGKVVLLSRGGCGFLEKVKWVQRRGGVALIVGDDIRGGPLVTMYARGDTSNVTIPSLFTSHTTAHLLSSLMPGGGLLGGLTPEEVERLGHALSDNSAYTDAQVDGKPVFTTTTAESKPTPTPKSQLKGKSVSHEATEEEIGWFKSLFSRSRSERSKDAQSPGSGHAGWVLQQDFDVDEDVPVAKGQKKQATTSTTAPSTAKTPESGSSDGFVIGVQDWRDPDLVAEQKEQLLGSSSSTAAAARNTRTSFWNGPKGGSITPGSGEYAKDEHKVVDLAVSKNSKDGKSSSKHSGSQEDQTGWFGNLFGAKGQEETFEPDNEKHDSKTVEHTVHAGQGSIHKQGQRANDGPELHQGLWVTLSPTSMSSSPFFDTLLVLVVSPLVTLTVVYALLLLRSRIRRRRWRAPKSVVERLPVRTYQTMPSTAAPSSTTSSISSIASATTPLLPSNARPINARSRPRSRTTPAVPIQASSSMQSDGMASPSLEQIEEKRAAGLAEWRKRYGGKQRECVVCLEEYVDGVSRVMSLPCGHEFHAECM